MLNKKRTWKAIRYPIRTIKLLNRRHLRFGLKSIDPEVHYMNGWVYGSIRRQPIEEIFPGIENVSYRICNAFRRTHNMSITIAELNSLLAIIKHLNAKNILEIGTFDGGTTLNIAANIPKGGLVTTIDLPYENSGYDIEFSEFMDNKSNSDKVGIQYLYSDYTDRISQVLEDSAKIDYEKLQAPFDIFFIDGCHDYNYVKNDTEKALKYTKKGGVIIWHDYGMIEDVSNYIDQLAKTIDIKAIKGCRLAVYINIDFHGIN